LSKINARPSIFYEWLFCIILIFLFFSNLLVYVFLHTINSI
jgi:hypothetical protein